MRKLQTYSIESDHTVSLTFTNGQAARVPISKIALYLADHDRAKIEHAVKVRRQFLKDHMPKLLVGAIVVTALGVAASSHSTMSRMFSHTLTPPRVRTVQEPLPAAAKVTPTRSPASLPTTSVRPLNHAIETKVTSDAVTKPRLTARAATPTTPVPVHVAAKTVSSMRVKLPLLPSVTVPIL